MFHSIFLEDKTHERLAGVYYLNNKNYPIEVKITFECKSRFIGSLAEPYMCINDQSAESVSGLIGILHNGDKYLTKTYLVMPDDCYILHFSGKIVIWYETENNH